MAIRHDVRELKLPIYNKTKVFEVGAPSVISEMTEGVGATKIETSHHIISLCEK